MATTFNEIPPIEQHTIECDLRAFTLWLNELKDQLNYMTNLYNGLKEQVEDNTYRINSLESRMNAVEQHLAEIDATLEAYNTRISALEGSGTGGAIDLLNGRVDMLYSWLPVPYGLIPGKGWKFAMGNLNVMKGTEPSNTDGPGIFTSGDVENNDLAFN